MKIYRLFTILIISVIALSCEKDMISFRKTDSFVAFQSDGGSIGEENTAEFPITVMMAAYKGDAVTVNFEFSTAGLENPAVEGIDFELVNPAKTLTFDSGTGTAEFRVRAIDNDERDLDRSVKIVLSGNSAGYAIGMAAGKGSEYVLTIIDNEHPLGKWIGTYTVKAASYAAPGDWDEVWTVTSQAHPDDGNKLILTGICMGSLPVTTTVDTENMTITIPAASPVGLKEDVYEDKTTIYYATDALIETGSAYTTANVLSQAAAIPIVGTLKADGSMVIPRITPVLSDYLWVWDTFDTTWTK